MKIIGIDLGGTNISGGLVEGDKVIKIIEEPTDRRGSRYVVQQLKSIIERLLEKGVVAVGIGVPSIVDTDKGVVYEVANIKGWQKVELAKALKEFKLPIFINNDANCFVLGEKYFGQAKRFKNVVGLTIGTGLGAGVIINDKIYNGRNCGAGEFCKIVYLDKDLEYYCSGNFFKKFYRQSGHDLFVKAKNGDKKAQKIFAEFGEHAGAALSMAALALDPEAVVIGGSIAQAKSFYEKEMLRSFKAKVYKQTAANLKIFFSQQTHLAILGAAALYLDDKK